MDQNHGKSDGSWLIVVLAALAVLLAFVAQARAHSWYDHDCCHEKDCSEVTNTSQVQLTGEKLPTLVVTTRFGTAPLTPQTKVRQSKDNNMHACILPGEMGSPPYLHCLYLPPSN